MPLIDVLFYKANDTSYSILLLISSCHEIKLYYCLYVWLQHVLHSMEEIRTHPSYNVKYIIMYTTKSWYFGSYRQFVSLLLICFITITL
jgi:hypothetical protein